MPTLYEIAKQYKHTGPSGKVVPNSESITKGIKPARGLPPTGYVLLTPDQLAALEVPQVVLNGNLQGYQRADSIRQGRSIARNLGRGHEVPPILVSIHDGRAFVTDGQHRGLAGIITRQSIPAVVKHRNPNKQARLFANQRQAKPVSPDTIVLAQHGLFAEYVQDAVTNASHPWGSIVGFSRSSSRIGPSQMLNLLQMYVGDAVRTQNREVLSDDRFDRGAADRLVQLLTAFGTRAENQLAWKPMVLRAITHAALKILRRSGEKPSDIERWERHMASFPFARFAHITTSRELAKELIRHWNKRLSPSRQVEV